jgi:serine/threonine protein kinase
MTHPVLPFPFEPDKTVVDSRFLIKGELGQGGMGRCYRAWQESLERLCVLKMLAPKLHPRFVPHQDARAMLENEAKTLGLLAHGNDSFVQVFDRGTVHILVRQDDASFELDLPYYTMEFLHGYSVEVLIEWQHKRQELLPWAVVLTLCAQTARALSVAHGRGVIHRDLKPDNIFIHRRFDRQPVVKLIDFGVSTREGEASLFGTGTARYGAPELLSQRAVLESTQSDVYPLGLVLFELAALRGPFVARSKADYMRAHVYEEPPGLAQLRPDVPPSFARLVAAALAKDQRARPTAKQAADELDAMLAGMASAKEANAQISQLLTHVGGASARQEAAARTREGRSRREPGTTLSGDGDMGLPPQNSTLYLLGRDSATAARGAAVDGAVPPTPIADRVASTATTSTATTVAPSRTPAVILRQPVVIESMNVHAAVASEVRIDDVAHVPVFHSMAQVFESVWEDDTRYETSPFDTRSEPPVRGGSISSLSAVMRRGAGEAELGLGETPAAMPVVQRPRDTENGRRRATRANILPALGVGLAACAVVMLAGTWMVSKGRGLPAATAPATPARAMSMPESVSTADPAQGLQPGKSDLPPASPPAPSVSPSSRDAQRHSPTTPIVLARPRSPVDHPKKPNDPTLRWETELLAVEPLPSAGARAAPMTAPAEALLPVPKAAPVAAASAPVFEHGLVRPKADASPPDRIR